MKKDVLVIGGGPGGYSAALYNAQLGMKVTLFEEENLGGTCLNAGCIPTKTFVQASNIYANILEAETYGVQIDGSVNINFTKTAKFKKKIVTQLRNGVKYLLQKAGVNVISGQGRIIDQNTVEVTSGRNVTTLNGDVIIIATGSSEIVIPGFEPDGVKVLNSTQMLDIQKLPESCIIIGGGVIGVEFASILCRFGKKVAIVELSSRLIPTEDIQISQTLKEELSQQGIQIYTDTQAEKILEKNNESISIQVRSTNGDLKTLTAEQILVCVGRRANLIGIGLDEAGIAHTSKHIITNPKMQTNFENIYAVGDVTASPQLAHVAYYEAKIAALNIAGQQVEASYHAIPGCIFSHPEIARAGMTEEEARANYENMKVHTVSFASNGKAMIEKENNGYIKLVLDGDAGMIVGMSIIGPKATELIAEPTLAVTLGLSVEEFANTINAHPSLSELIGEVVGVAAGLSLHS